MAIVFVWLDKYGHWQIYFISEKIQTDTLSVFFNPILTSYGHLIAEMIAVD